MNDREVSLVHSALLELPPDLLPRVAGFHEPPTGQAKRVAPLRVPEESNHRASEVGVYRFVREVISSVFATA